MKKSLIIAFCFFALSFYCKGQKVTFSPIVKSSEDASVQAIALLWEDYIKQLWKDFVSTMQGNHPSDSIQKTFWYNNSEDLLKGKPPTNFYQAGNLLTFNIRKYSDTIYEIYSLQQMPDNETVDILFSYKVCAIKTEGGFKLINYFDVIKHTLQNYSSEYVKYYYPCGYNFDINKVLADEKFIKQFQSDYNLKKIDKKIVYIIGNNFKESNSFIGYDFMIGTDENKYAAICLFPATIITQRQNHFHEFVHILLGIEYPDMLDILNEGIATYYGGTSGLDYVTLRNTFKNNITENPIDFSELSSFYPHLKFNEFTQSYYIVGAVIIEYALKHYGKDKVIELFSCKEYQEIYTKLGITPLYLVDFLLND